MTDHTNAMNTRQATEAARVRALAGSTWNRRGSVLVLVVGVLALLAIIIVVYTSVGQADVRGGRTLVNQARLEDQSRAVGDYLNRIIGNDAVAVRNQRVDITGSPDYYSERESFDYPSTDPYSRSVLTVGGGFQADFARFDPAGSISRVWTGSGLDPRAASDPWLATTEPQWINRTGTLTMPAPRGLMAQQRDWRHLSVASPDGRVVNLANLRGNFNAPSGFSANPYAPAGAHNISDFLYTSNRAGRFFDAPTLQTQAVAEYNKPATWSSDRLETFRPVTFNPAGWALGDVRFMGNTMADADGDGWYDSLWQELVDASDPARPVSILPGGAGVRWFVAPRVVDLSSMVNVNTATSFMLPPDIENPAGITPSDVDLERLLTMADVRQYFGIVPQSDFVEGNTFYSGTSSSIDVGRWAFAGIFESRLTGLPEVLPGPNGFGPNTQVSTDMTGIRIQKPEFARQAGVQLPGGGATGTALGAATRRVLYTIGGKDDSGQLRNPVNTNANYYLQQPGGFGLGDELDLRAFGSVNDPRTRTRLEAVSENNRLFPLASPLRGDRDLNIDRDAGIMDDQRINTPLGEVPRGMAQYLADPRHLLTTLSGARPIANLPRRMSGPNDATDRSMSNADLRVDISPLLTSAVVNQADAARGVFPLSAANEIFVNYSLALSPFLGDPDIWDTASANKRSLTLSYGGLKYKASAVNQPDYGDTDAPTYQGRTAEIATRLAAHLTLNLLAWQDNSRVTSSSVQPDNRPLGATVLFDNALRGNVSSDLHAGGTRKFPYWQAGATVLGSRSTDSPSAAAAVGDRRTDPKAYTFDLNMIVPQQHVAGNVPRLAQGQYSASDSYAVNVFAAQPQPFITSAHSYVMYWDAPAAGRGGDDQSTGGPDGEWEVVRDPMTNAPVSINSLGITMRGNIDLSNNDFLMECVAFQVTNPFDVPLTLHDSTTGFGHYFEFGGKFYAVSEFNDAGVPTNANVVLQPRQSRVFYALSQNVDAMNQRWIDNAPGVAGLADSSGNAASRWIKRQLSVAIYNGGAPIRTMPIDPADGRVIPSGAGVTELLSSTATGDENKVVRLWRVTRDPSERSANRNDRANDVLVDRLRDPALGTGDRASLFRRLPDGQNRFSSIAAGPETGVVEGVPFPPQDNVGFAVTFYGSVRRRTDPTGGPAPSPAGSTEATAGVIPSWCMEPKSEAGYSVATGSGNVRDFNSNISQTNNLSTAGGFAGEEWGGRSLRDMISKAVATGGNGFSLASQHPTQWTGNLIGPARDGQAWSTKRTQLPVYPRRINALPANEVERPPLRPADLLMPWAIGPWQDPNRPVAEDRHTTLSEAIAFGLGYAEATDQSRFESQLPSILQNNRLHLSRFIPFNDNNNGVWNYNNGNPDPRISNGVPFALNVLDRFRTSRYGTLDSAVPGLVNINTAPLSVLRMLPMLTPVSANFYGNDGDAFKEHWMLRDSSPISLKRRDGTNDVNTVLWADNRTWDAAAALVAYRDQIAAVVRGHRDDEGGASRRFADFSPRNDNSAVTSAGHRGGRAKLTNQPAVRTELGFQSPGEVLMAFVEGESDRATGLSLDERRQIGMNRLAAAGNANEDLTNFKTPVKRISDVSVLGSTGTEQDRDQAIGWTAQASLRPALGSKFVHGGDSSDYDRRVGLANAILNTISVRSDVFACYFLLHGYAEGDVQGLEPWTGGGAAPGEDRYTRPMTPSVQRRYLMVVDRSNCVRSGDKPRVLMFEELPVK